MPDRPAEVCAQLLAATGASRTTVRVVAPDGSISLVGEALAPGVQSMRDGPQPAITTAPTYIELERGREPILQSDTRTQPPAPPASLVEHYRVWAQMLAPVVVDDVMVATISVHQQEATRSWSEADRAALLLAQRQVAEWWPQRETRPGPDPIPIIDLSRPRALVSTGIREACETVGFFGVTGSGVDPEAVKGAYRAAADFFGLPAPAKARVARPRPELNRGYVGPGEEALARLEGRPGPADAKEAFTVGPDSYALDEYHTSAAARPHWGPNLWPADLADFRPAVLAYWAAMHDLGMRLVDMVGAALGVDMAQVTPDLAGGPHQLRIIRYPGPHGPLEPGQMGAGAHTDLGLLTVLHASSNAGGGLEVESRDGRWMPAPDFDGFMVNIGDALMRWTNDRWRSTRHRVRPPRGQDGRTSMAFFLIPHYDTVIECLPPFCGEGNPALYPPITMGDYRAARFASTATY